MKVEHNADRFVLANRLHEGLLKAAGGLGKRARAVETIKYYAVAPVASQLVFEFNQGHEGSFDVDLRGGKGLGLAQLKRLGMPVPSGSTILTTVSRQFEKSGRLPKRLAFEVVSAIRSLEKETGLGFGDVDKPLLISVRSGAPASIAGTMDTVLNVGLNRQCIPALADRAGDRFAWDCYRRYLTMFGVTVLNARREIFEGPLKAAMTSAAVDRDSGLSVEQLKSLCLELELLLCRSCGMRLPNDPYEQLALAIVTVLESWQSECACALREEENISHVLGTAVNLQAMVFGNKGETSGTGVIFSANPNTGADGIYGEFLANAQGDDVVSGTRNAGSVHVLQKTMPDVYAALVEHAARLSAYYSDLVEIEFTVECSQLYLLQVRKAKRSKEAAINFAVNQVTKGLWIQEDAIMSIGLLYDDSDDSDNSCLGSARFNQEALLAAMSKGYMSGTTASPGVASGHLRFTIDGALAAAERGENVILARMDTHPDDLPTMLKSKAIITACGGTTCHAALVARGLHIPAMVACNFIIDTADKLLIAYPGGVGLDQEACTLTFSEGELVSIGGHVDGQTGVMIRGQVASEVPEASHNANLVKQWYRETELNLNSYASLDAHLADSIWDINQWHNDFYLVNSMARSSDDKFNVLVKAKQNEIEHQLAQILTCYLAIAVYTELRHLNRCAKDGKPGTRLLELGELRGDESAATNMQRLASNERSYQVEFFRLASQAFLDHGSSGSFCGRPWSLIANAPGEYLAGVLPASIYIDHVFDLKHNGGRLFDKHQMAQAVEQTLHGQLDIKKSAPNTSKLFKQLTTAYGEVCPEVLDLYDRGAQAGLWQGRQSKLFDREVELEDDMSAPDASEIAKGNEVQS